MNTVLTRRSTLVWAILLLGLLIGLRFFVEPITAALEAQWGPLLVNQQFHPMRWLWAFEATQPIRPSRWLLLTIALIPTLYLVLSRISLPQKTWVYVAICVGMFALYWLFRAKIGYGDAGRYEDYMLRGIVPGAEGQTPDPKVLFMSSPLSTALFYVVYHVLFPGVFSAEDAIAFVHATIGLIYVTAMVWSVQRYVAGAAKLPVLLLLLSIPATVHFFGYREATSVTPGLAGAYIALALWQLHTPKLWKLVLASFIAGLATAAHGVGYMLAASVAYLWLSYLVHTIREKQLINGVLGVLLGAVSYFGPFRFFFFLSYRNPSWVFGHPKGDSGDAWQGLLPQNWLGTLRLGCANSGVRPPERWCYPVFSKHQFFDLLSGTFRLWPAGLIVMLIVVLTLLYLARNYEWRNVLNDVWHSRILFLSAVFAGALGFLLLFPPMLGFIQDWDLFGPSYIVMATVTALFMGFYIPDAVWKKPVFRLTVSIMIALNLASLTEFLFWLQPRFFGETLVPLLQQLGIG